MWCGDLLQQLGLLACSMLLLQVPVSTLVDEHPGCGKSPKGLILSQAATCNGEL